MNLPPDVISVLTEYNWPGNVRELENIIERLVVTGKNDTIGVGGPPAEVRAQPTRRRARSANAAARSPTSSTDEWSKRASRSGRPFTPLHGT